MAITGVTLKGHTQWDYDMDVLKPTIRREGAEVRKLARRLVSRRAVSKPGEFPGRDEGTLQKTIKTKILSGGLGVIITHRMSGTRYPFMLAHGTKHIEPRADYIEEAINQRRSATNQALRAALARGVFTPK